MSTPITTEEEDKEETNKLELDQGHQDPDTPPVGGQRVPVTAEQEPADTTNAISTEKEIQEQEQQQHSSVNPNAAENGRPVYSTQNPLMTPPPNQQQTQSLSAQDTQPQQQESRSNPQTETFNAQQPISATTSAGVTAPKPKADFSNTDATIQGLLVQIIALQHNKIQQLNNNQQEQ